MQKSFGLTFPLLCILLLLWIEQGLGFPYSWKTVAKGFLFLLIPLLIFRSTRFPFLQLHLTNRKSIRFAVGSGVAIMSAIILSFILLKPYIDIDALLVNIAGKGVTSTTFPFIALYILFGNSFIEEFFFRGILPSLITNFRIRLLMPSFFFAIYHVTIFLAWFSTPLLLFAIIGLWVGGIIFQLINERSKTILPSWTIHMFADIGVLLVGVYMIYFY